VPVVVAVGGPAVAPARPSVPVGPHGADRRPLPVRPQPLGQCALLGWPGHRHPPHAGAIPLHHGNQTIKESIFCNQNKNKTPLQKQGKNIITFLYYVIIVAKWINGRKKLKFINYYAYAIFD
jgi:hypothetical protein